MSVSRKNRRVISRKKMVNRLGRKGPKYYTRKQRGGSVGKRMRTDTRTAIPSPNFTAPSSFSTPSPTPEYRTIDLTGIDKRDASSFLIPILKESTVNFVAKYYNDSDTSKQRETDDFLKEYYDYLNSKKKQKITMEKYHETFKQLYNNNIPIETNLVSIIFNSGLGKAFMNYILNKDSLGAQYIGSNDGLKDKKKIIEKLNLSMLLKNLEKVMVCVSPITETVIPKEDEFKVAKDALEDHPLFSIYKNKGVITPNDRNKKSIFKRVYIQYSHKNIDTIKGPLEFYIPKSGIDISIPHNNELLTHGKETDFFSVFTNVQKFQEEHLIPLLHTAKFQTLLINELAPLVIYSQKERNINLPYLYVLKHH